MELEGSDLSGRYKTQLTSAGYSTGHCATVNKQQLKVSPSPNHNPKWRFTLGGNGLSQLFIIKQ